MKKRWPALVLFMALALLPFKRSNATITSVTLIPAPPTLLSNGNSYYLAGIQYSFRVQAVDPDATALTDWNQITLTIGPGVGRQVVIDIAGASVVGLPAGLYVAAGGITVTAPIPTNIDVQINLYIRWDCPETVYASNTVTAVVTNDLNLPAGGLTATQTFNYGVCSSTRVLNFLQDGVAADGRVNPWHDGFNVTGAIVYNVAGAVTIADRIEAHDPGEITNTILLRDGVVAAGIANDATMADDCTFAVTDQYLLPLALGNHNWRIRSVMTIPGGPDDSPAASQLVINVDRVRIRATLATDFTFINGGGVDTPAFYRSVNQPGTQVRLYAVMENSGATMFGNTTIQVRNVTDGINFPVQVLNGQNVGIGNVPNPVVAANSTEDKVYRIEAITSGAYNDDVGAGNGQDRDTRILQPANQTIYWDNLDPPGINGAPFITDVLASTTAYSITLTWTPLQHIAGTPPYDGDLDTYRVYFRPTGSTTWSMLDRTSTGYAALGTYGTGTVTITDLNPLTAYDYCLSAIDVFGNVVLYGVNEAPTSLSSPSSISTQYRTIECTLSDGHLTYPDAHFQANAAGASRLVRKTAIKVTFFLITVGRQPDYANLILVKGDYNSYSAPPGPVGSDLIVGSAINGAYNINSDYYRIPLMKTAPNTWVGYIPETNPFMQIGNTLSFLLESSRLGALNYSDATKSEIPPGDPNDRKWAFKVGVQNVFTPWPTRVLNNVITKKNPVAYPSFYLSENALVTIRIYDIKGRPVMTLLDNSPRAGGQNIAEGWSGVNRYNNKVGVGLYYIHIQARSAVSGKIILNSFKKVVVAK